MEEYGELLRTLLEKRNIKDKKQIDIFLNPDYERDFHNPFLMKDMEKVCVRILNAIGKKEKIVIYADYDCDGIPGAVILGDFFKKINYKNYEIYIPQRNSEGYGLNLDAIKNFIKDKTSLLITIDLGITAFNEISYAQKNGIDVIITDHHIPPEILPKAYAILNPKTDDYPEKMLCGAGVVFKLIQGLLKEMKKEKFNTSLLAKTCQSPTLAESLFSLPIVGWEKWLLDMVGLATVSDMVPLIGENRAMAYFGLKVLKKSRRPGLQKLLKKIKIDQRYLTEDDIGFMIAPRLNAASRIDNPRKAFDLLFTDNETEGGMLADYLSKINDERKMMVASIMREAKKKIDKRDKLREIIVIGNPSWRVGVLGLVAGKLSDNYNKPVFVWGKDENDMIKGSCRSPGFVSLVNLMKGTKEYFLEFGGHELAGGFSVKNDKIHFLEEALSLSFNKMAKKNPLEAINYDIKTELNTVNMKNWREIEKLAPFGLGNPKPIFLFEDVIIYNIKKFGKNGSGEHLEITFTDTKQNQVKGISFFSNIKSFQVDITENIKVNLLATFDLSRFRGREELRLRIEDIY